MPDVQEKVNRIDGRSADQLRDYSFERGFIKTAEGSVLVTCGETRVIVTAKVDANVPGWMRGQGHGWITAEYAMLPGCSQERIRRERSKVSGRSQEIQRLIGRSLRAMVELKKLPELTINIDADVIQADGGTRTASITGAYVAVYDCMRHLKENGIWVPEPREKDLEAWKADPEREIVEQKDGKLLVKFFKSGLPITNQIAAISVGLRDGQALLDLNYEEDSSAQADGNFILTSDLNIVEVQTTAEDGVVKPEEFNSMFELARKGIKDLCNLQNKALS